MCHLAVGDLELKPLRSLQIPCGVWSLTLAKMAFCDKHACFKTLMEQFLR